MRSSFLRSPANTNADVQFLNRDSIARATARLSQAKSRNRIDLPELARSRSNSKIWSFVSLGFDGPK